MKLPSARPWPSATRGRRLLAPALVIAALCGTALLTPLTGRMSSADVSAGPYTGQLGMMSSCFLPNAAFCDNFSEGPYGGGAANRGGDLDPAKWSFSRLTEGVNPGQGLYFAYPPATAQFCQTVLPGVLPPRDSFMCNGTNGQTTQFQGLEDMHWMTTINDGGSYVANSARILQPFDISGRTGTVAFMVDAVTRGPHSFWPSVVLADQPINEPHEAKPGVNSPPRNGVQVDFNAGCGSVPDGSTDFPATTVGQVSIFTNYAEQALGPQELPTLGCAQALRDHPNLIVLQYSPTSLDVWMADDVANMQPGMPMPTPTPKHVLHLDQTNGYNLNLTRGYLSFQQAHYDAEKFNGDSTMTYHWHAIGFDGPALPADRDYEAPNSGGPVTMNYDGLTAVGENIGYQVNGTSVTACCAGGGSTLAQPFVLKGVDLTGATTAAVTFNWREDSTADPGLQVRVNGQAWHNVAIAPGSGSYVGTGAIAAIPVSELRNGDNTLEINAPNGVIVANIDLMVDPVPGAIAPTTTATTTTTTSSMLMSSSTASTASSTALSSSTASIATSSSSMLMNNSATSSTSSSSSMAASTHPAVSQTSTTSSTTTSTTRSTSSSATSTSTRATTTSSSTASTASSATSTSASASAPTFSTSAKLSHYMQYSGRTLDITANVQDLTGTLSNGIVEVEVVAPDGTRAFDQQVQVQHLNAGQSRSYRFTVTAPSTKGTYKVMIAVYGPNGSPRYTLNDAAASFTVI